MLNNESINDVYTKVLLDVWTKGNEVSPRGMKVKELLGYNFVLDNPKDNVITIPGLKTNVKYAQEEFEWYVSGSNRIDYSPLIKKVWEKYSDDGVHVNSAYGYYMFNQKVANGITQWEWAKKQLTKDKDTRQAIININQPYHKDGETKDFPCTIFTQQFIRDNKLYWLTVMRSNDVYLGLRNDVYTFTMLQQKMAEELNLDVGQYHHFASSMHLYEQQFDKVKTYLQDRKLI